MQMGQTPGDISLVTFGIRGLYEKHPRDAFVKKALSGFWDWILSVFLY